MNLPSFLNSFQKNDHFPVIEKRPWGWVEIGWLGIILALGLSFRIVFAVNFPTQPISDFQKIVEFGLHLGSDPFAKGFRGWIYLNPGLPIIFSLLFKGFGGDPAVIARWASVFMTGLLPIIPFVGWKNVYGLPARIISSLLLALWPGLIFFSTVASQDSWVLFPTILLTTLAVRALVRKSNGHPVLSSLCFVIAFAIRQEMLLILLPLAVLCATGLDSKNLLTNLLKASAIVGLSVSLLILQRGLATGRYTLSTSHFSSAILGSYIPGAGLTWLDPKPFLAGTNPALLDDEKRLDASGLTLVWHEIASRPMFQFIRVLTLPSSDIFLSFENKLAYWSILAPGSLPPEKNIVANELMVRINPYLQAFSSLVHIIFFSALAFLFLSKTPPLSYAPLLFVFLSKIALHALIVSQSRFYLTPIAMEFLIIGVAVDVLTKASNKKAGIIQASSLGSVAFVLILMLTQSGISYIARHDKVPQYPYSFSLLSGNTRFYCSTKQGRILSFYEFDTHSSITLDFGEPQPVKNTRAMISCSTQIPQDKSIRIIIYPQSTQSFPTGIVTREFLYNGSLLIKQDATETGTQVILRPSKDGKVEFSFEMWVIAKDTRSDYGSLAVTEIQIFPPDTK